MVKPLFAVLLAGICSLPSCRRAVPPGPMPAAGVAVGQLAPDVAGVDLKGDPIRLSDHRGKVVALSFWAGWCPPCRAMFPHEIKLVDEMKGRPFVLLGVNGDNTPEQGLAVSEKAKLNFRSFHGGRDGPIVSQYGLEGWPTTFVIDATGVVRHVAVGFDPAGVHDAVREQVEALEKRK